MWPKELLVKRSLGWTRSCPESFMQGREVYRYVSENKACLFRRLTLLGAPLQIQAPFQNRMAAHDARCASCLSGLKGCRGNGLAAAFTATSGFQVEERMRQGDASHAGAPEYKPPRAEVARSAQGLS